MKPGTLVAKLVNEMVISWFSPKKSINQPTKSLDFIRKKKKKGKKDIEDAWFIVSIDRNNSLANNNIFLILIQKSIPVLESNLIYAQKVIEGVINVFLNVFLNLDTYE